MAGNTLTSSLIVRLVDQVTAPARAISRSLLGLELNSKKGFGANLAGAIERNNQALAAARGKLFDAAAGFYVLRSAFEAPMRAAADFETQLEDIGQKADIPTERLKELGVQIRQIARDTNQSTSQIASAVDNLVGQGASEDVALAASGPIGKAATAYRAATDDLAAASYAAVNNLKVPADQIGTALDMMAQAGKEGAFELRDMAQYFPALAAQYQGLGQSGTSAVADLAAALQIVRIGTGDASTAATNLQNVLQKIYSNRTVKGFETLGVDIRKEMDKAGKAGQTPIEAIAEITNKTLKGDLTRLGEVFEDAQVQAGMRTLIQNMEKYRDIRKDALGATGVVDTDFERRTKTAQGVMDRFSASMENLKVSLGSTLTPLLSDIADKIIPIVDAIGGWIEKNPELASSIATATAALIAFKVAGAGLSFVGLLGQAGALQALSLAYNTFGKAVMGAQEAVRLQSSLAAMSGANINALDKLAAGLKGMALSLPGISGLASAFPALGAAIAGIGAAGVAVVAGIAVAGFTIWKYWDRISSIFSGVTQALGELIAQIPGGKESLEWLGGIGQAIGDGFKAAWDAVAGFFGDLFKQETLSDDQKEGMKQAGYNAIMSMLEGMKSMWNDVLAWFASWPQQILNAIGSIDISSLFKWRMPWDSAEAPATNNGSAVINGQVDPGLPAPGPVSGQRAAGGPVWAGSTYRINERGQEFFTPGRSGTIHPAGGALGGRPVNIGPFTFNGISGDPDELERRVQAAVERGVDALLRGSHADMEARA